MFTTVCKMTFTCDVEYEICVVRHAFQMRLWNLPFLWMNDFDFILTWDKYFYQDVVIFMNVYHIMTVMLYRSGPLCAVCARPVNDL